MKVKGESEATQSCLTLRTPWTGAHQAPPSMAFSRQEYWSRLPLPSPSYSHRGTFDLTEYAEAFKHHLHPISSVQFSRSVVSDSLWSHELQHTRPPCPSPTPGVHSNSRPSSQWCHPAISSSVVPFSSCPQSLPASESFPMSKLFAWGGQNTGVSALASFLPKNTQDWSTSPHAKSLQSCPTLCDPINGSPPGSPIPGILQARTLEWVVISFSNAWKWKVKVQSLNRVRLFTTPWTAAHQAPPSMGFSRQEYWSGVPFLLKIFNHALQYICLRFIFSHLAYLLRLSYTFPFYSVYKVLGTLCASDISTQTFKLPFHLLLNWGEKSPTCHIPKGEGGLACLHLPVGMAKPEWHVVQDCFSLDF